MGVKFETPSIQMEIFIHGLVGGNNFLEILIWSILSICMIFLLSLYGYSKCSRNELRNEVTIESK